MVDLEVNTLDIPFIITSKDGERINLFQSLLFDIHLSTEVETFNEVLDLVKMHLDKGITSRRIGGRSLKLLILNLYLAWKNEGASCVAISRDNNSYKARSRYNSLGISRIVVDVLDLLIDRGYVEQKIGWADPLTNRSYYTRIWGTKKLQALFEEVEFSPLDLEYDSNRETIILRDGEGEDIEYADATAVCRMRAVVERYNNFLSHFFIDIPTLESGAICVPSGKSENWFYVNNGPNFTYRVFNRNSFELGGRFYGGWWQNIPKEYRPRIFIDDRPTSEVDYRNNHVVLLYNLKDLEMPRSDAYSISKPSELSHISEYRSLVKKLLLMAVNADDEKKTFQAFRSDAARGSAEAKLKDNQLQLVLDLLKDKHHPIADRLCSGAGIKLQFIDSQITEKIITRFMDNEVPILIIHDSYIVPDGQESFLEGTMTWAFQEVTGKTYVPMKEDTHHPERYLPESPDDWSNAEAVEEAIKWRYDPERCDRYLRELKRFVDAKELPVNVGSGWDVSDYLEADR